VSAFEAYLVRGSDVVGVDRALSRLLDELVGDDRMAVTEVSEDEPVAAIVDSAQTPPLFTERRVVLARGSGRFSSAEVAPLVTYLRDPLPTTSLVLVGGGGQLARGLVEAVRQVGHVIDADVPRGRARTTWVASQLAASPIHLDKAAATLVADHLGEDLSRLHALVELLTAAYGEGARLGPDDLGPYLGQAGATAPWELTDAIDRADPAGAIAALHRLLGAGGRHPLAVLATLHTHYARLLRLDGDDEVTDERSAAAALGLTGSTFPARKALAAARRLGHDAIARAIALLADADLALKGALEWPGEVVLEVLVARLSLLGRPSAGGRQGGAGARGGATRR